MRENERETVREESVREKERESEINGEKRRERVRWKGDSDLERNHGARNRGWMVLKSRNDVRKEERSKEREGI